MLLDKGETFMIVVTKIMLPTVDVFTDLNTIIRVFMYPKEYNRQRAAKLHAVGYAMVCVLVLSWIMTIPHFLRVEKSRKQRL